MLASNLNRIVTIEKEDTIVNAVGTPTEEYVFMKDAWASFKIITGSTDYTEEGSLPYSKAEFLVRYDDAINYKCRLIYDNQYYEIGHIETVGRKDWMKIRCTVWEGELNNAG